jgi:small GTP-binding protein
MTDMKHIKFKICLLGNPGVGKTSLIQKYVYDFFGDVYIRTMGTKVSRKVIKIENRNTNKSYDVTMMIWDIMGQKIQSVLHKTYFKFSKGALIVCDVTRKNTILDSEEWANNLYEITGEIPIVFLANKTDLKDKASITEEDLKELAGKFNAPYYFTSAKTGENVNSSFHRLGKMMLDTIPLEKPEKKAVAQELEPMKLIAAGSENSDAFGIKPGGSYLIKEEKPVKSFKIFKRLLNDGVKGLCITRTHPNMVQNQYNIGEVPIQWLTTGQQDDNTLPPTFLPKVTSMINEFITKNQQSAIILEGIEYLIDQNDFKSVLKMIHSINDAIMRGNSILILPLDPYILEKRELHLLSRDLIAVT